MKKLLGLFVLFIGAGASVYALNSNKIDNVDNPSVEGVQTESQVVVVIDFGDRQEEGEVSIGTDETAYSVLEQLAVDKNIELSTKQYDFGVFVESIDGKESGTEMSWIYFVNGESGNVAADQKQVMPGDKVEWKYVKPL